MNDDYLGGRTGLGYDGVGNYVRWRQGRDDLERHEALQRRMLGIDNEPGASIDLAPILEFLLFALLLLSSLLRPTFKWLLRLSIVAAIVAGTVALLFPFYDQPHVEKRISELINAKSGHLVISNIRPAENIDPNDIEIHWKPDGPSAFHSVTYHPSKNGLKFGGCMRETSVFVSGLYSGLFLYAFFGPYDSRTWEGTACVPAHVQRMYHVLVRHPEYREMLKAGKAVIWSDEAGRLSVYPTSG